MVFSSHRPRGVSVPEFTRTPPPTNPEEDELIERLRAMTIPETSLNTNNDSFVIDDIIEEHDSDSQRQSVASNRGQETGKATREWCAKASIQNPDFEELETTASQVQQGIGDLRKDLADLRQIQVDYSRAFKADIQKKLLEFRKKAARVNDFVKHKMDQNNNHFFSHEQPIREQRFLLTADQKDYRKISSSTEEELTELEIHMELIRLNVVQTKRIEHPSQIEDFITALTRIVKNVSDVKKKYFGMEGNLKRVMEGELQVIKNEERFLKEEPDRLENLTRRCRVLAGTVETLKKLVEMQRNPSSSNSPAGSKRSFSTGGTKHTLV